jgi:hypothetical protein
MSGIPTDPRKLIKSLDPDSIRERLEEMDGERRALLTLLRAALCKRRDRTNRPKGGDGR